MNQLDNWVYPFNEGFHINKLLDTYETTGSHGSVEVNKSYTNCPMNLDKFCRVMMGTEKVHVNAAMELYTIRFYYGHSGNEYSCWFFLDEDDRDTHWVTLTQRFVLKGER